MTLSRRLRLGRLWYLVWHQPRGFLEDVSRQGGLKAWIAMRRGQRALAKAAVGFTAPINDCVDGITLNFLTGNRYWDQSAACLRTLQHHSARSFRVRFIDDGTLTEKQASVLERLSQGGSVQSEPESHSRLCSLLPPDRFPTIHLLWREYKHIRKLTDVHVGRQGINLVLDSDMLFHARPDELLDWCQDPSTALVMRDCEESYGYPRDSMRELTRTPIPDRINVGIVGIRSESIDWPLLESWASQLLEVHGRSYFLEQALCAMLLSRMPHRILDDLNYRVIARAQPEAESKACLVHYVSGAKRQYFDRDWKAIR